MSTKREKVVAPRGLSARTFTAGGDELVLFTWGDEGDGPVSKPLLGLSAAEEVVLGLLVRGASNREIATSRGVSERTIANQVASVLRKAGARSRYELIRRFSIA